MSRVRGVRKTAMILFAAVIMLCVAATAVYAAVLFSFSVGGSITGATEKVNDPARLYLSIDATHETLRFTTAGERIVVPLTVNNKTGANIVYRFGLSSSAASGADTADTVSDAESLSRLTSAILVYFDGEFRGTLAQLTVSGETLFDNGFVMSGSTDAARTVTHELAFELHIAAAEELLGKSVDINVATYAQNADYRDTIFVSNADELVRAVDDINSGLLDRTVTLALANDVTLSTALTVNYPVNINLCGKTLTLGASLTLSGAGTSRIYSSVPTGATSLPGDGGIVLDSTGGVLDIDDFDAGRLYAAKTTVKNCDKSAAAELIAARVAQNLRYGAAMGVDVDVLGALSFYETGYNGLTFGVEGACEYKPATAKLYATGVVTSVGTFNIRGASVDKSVEFRLIGGNDSATLESILKNELAHIPNTKPGDDPVLCDIFLPERIEDKNVRIEWTSSDESSLNSDGRLADTLAENTPVTLYAKIIINDSVYTHSYSFTVSSQTRETKFRYLVAQLSPIQLTKVYKSATDTDALYYLPIVDPESDHDYRKKFTLADGRTWEFKDIGLTSLSYTVKSSYNFISMQNTTSPIDSAVYLNSATFYTFAQLTVRGEFEGGEAYEDNVNVIIKLGDNSDLYELVFSYVEKRLGNIDILQNIIDTRATYGAKYERGDFYLPPEYQGIEIKYEPSESGKTAGIPAITQETDGDKLWHVSVDPTRFTSAESSVGIKVTVKKEGDPTGGASRILYVSAPAVIKPDENGFANYSVFSSVKYQTLTSVGDVADEATAARLKNLPAVTVDAADAGSKPTGFTTGGNATSGATVTNNTGDYILVRDAAIVGTLRLVSGNNAGTSTTSAHDKAYRLAQLLEWATGDSTDGLPFTVGSYGTATRANGREHLNETEAAVIRAYLTELGFTEAEITELWSKTMTTPGGGAHIIEDYAAVINAATTYANTGELYFKYTEVLQWALNEKDFPREGNNFFEGGPPNLGYIGKYNVYMGVGSTTTLGINWSSNPDNWTYQTASNYGKYRSADCVEDNSEYISDTEAQCIMAFFFGISPTYGKAFAKVFLASCVIPTYLHEDGAGILVNAVYDKLRTADNGGVAATAGNGFTVALTDGVPEISVLDFSFAGLNYFTSLTEIEVVGVVEGGKVTLPAFITSGAVSGYFGRITRLDADRTSPKLERFVMRGCTAGHSTLSLEYVARLSGVEQLDFSYNPGITSVGDLLNLNIQQISYLDVHGVSVENDYLTYVLENIKVNAQSSKLYYTSGSARTEYVAKSDKVSDELRFLRELTAINSPYLMLAKKAYANSATGTDDGKVIQWYVERGNPAYIVSAGGADTVTGTITTAEEMVKMLKNYYVCTQDVPEYGLEKGKIYRIQYQATSGVELVETGYTCDVDSGVLPDKDQILWDDQGQTVEYTSEQQGGSANVPNNTYTSDNIRNQPGYKAISTSGSWILLNGSYTYAYGVYKIEPTVDQIITYRFYQNTSKVYKSANCLVNNAVEQGSYLWSGTRYIEYQVTAKNTYTQYYYKPNNYGTTLNRITTNFSVYNGSSYTDVDAVTSVISSITIPSYTGAGTFTSQSAAENYLKSLFESNDSSLPEYTVTTSVSVQTIFSYTTSISDATGYESAIREAENVRTSFVLYRYTGNTGSHSYYENGSSVTSTRYVANQGYRLTFGTSGYAWEAYNIKNSTAATTMDSILAEANSHKNDALFGNYYGNYYCFTGTTVSYDGGARTYTNSYVYRLLTDEDGNFYFEQDTRKFQTITSADALKAALLGAAKGSADYPVGMIIYLETSISSMYYAKGLFELTYNTQTQVYYFKTMGGVGNITFNGSSYTELNPDGSGQNLSEDGISKFINIRYAGTASQTLYSGTGGSEDVVIVARIVDDGNTYERKFKVTVSASGSHG